jgi:sterol 3beta-glucosyltransferase
MTRILILTIGSRGDVQPYIALEKGLITRGHKVRLATLSKFSQLVREAGIEFAPLDAGTLQILDTPEGQSVLSTGLIRNGAKLIRRIRPILEPLLDNAWSAAQGIDLIVIQPLALAGNSIAEKLEIPGVFAIPSPLGASASRLRGAVAADAITFSQIFRSRAVG